MKTYCYTLSISAKSFIALFFYILSGSFLVVLTCYHDNYGGGIAVYRACRESKQLHISCASSIRVAFGLFHLQFVLATICRIIKCLMDCICFSIY